MQDDGNQDDGPNRKGGKYAQPQIGEYSGVTEDLLRLMPRDVVFSLRFLGESQHVLHNHFQDFIRQRLAADGVTQETHPLIHGFIDTHAILLRDFVFSGVSLAHQLRIEEFERLIGDTTSITRVDIWDQLQSHIDTAERQFVKQISSLQPYLEALEDPARKRKAQK